MNKALPQSDANGSQKVTTCPIVIKLLGISTSKPPAKNYSVKLQVSNVHSDPMWFVFRYYGDEALPGSGRFDGSKSKDQPFSSNLFTKRAKNEKGQAVEVNFLGDKTFGAFRLRPASKIILDNFVFTAFKDVNDYEVWEVDSLVVNGKAPLEQWLPYPVLSDQSVHLGSPLHPTSLDWDKRINNYRQDYPNEKVEFVTAHAINKCVVPLK